MSLPNLRPRTSPDGQKPRMSGARIKELEREEHEQRKSEMASKLANLEKNTAMERRYSKEKTLSEMRRESTPTGEPTVQRRLSKNQLKEARSADGVWKPSKELLDKQGRRPSSQAEPKRRPSKEQVVFENAMVANLEAASRHGLRNLDKMRGEKSASSRLAKRRASTPADIDLIRKEMGLAGPKPGDGRATRLAMMYRMDLSEVQYALQQFEEADVNRSGGLDKDEFRCAMAKIVGKNPWELADETLQNAWEKVSGHGGNATSIDEMSIEKFFEWYMVNQFQRVSHARSSDTEKEVYELSERLGAPPPVIDKLRAEFERFDKDNSGSIEYDEFAEMLFRLLKCKNEGDLSQDRLHRFWAEIDADASGSVDFAEFCVFYLKYFISDLSSVSRDGGLVGQFYASFDPVVQRRKSKEKAVDAEVAAALSLGMDAARDQLQERDRNLLRRSSV
jgi:Ca2+-binding EF-hand superfamily protein